MKERLARLKSIKKLIKTNRIESQEELLTHLQKDGFDVTQATLSRDLKLLKVGKVSDGTSCIPCPVMRSAWKASRFLRRIFYAAT